MARILIIFTILLPTFLTAQQKVQGSKSLHRDTSSIKQIRLIAHNYGDSIVLRWAPGAATEWFMANKEGYNLTKTTFQKKGKDNYKQISRKSYHIPVWTLRQWSDYYNQTQDSLIAIAAQLIYGKVDSIKEQSLDLENILNIYQRQKNRYGMAMLVADFSPMVAQGMGLRFTDKDVDRNHYYTYEVTPAFSQPASQKDTSLVFAPGGMVDSFGIVQQVEAIAGDRMVHLFWKNAMIKNTFTAFYIERSDNGNDFTRLNTLPYLSSHRNGDGLQPIEYVDTGLINYKTYSYRVTGISAFGDLSKPSAIVNATPVDMTPPRPPVIDIIKDTTDGKHIYIHWKKALKDPDFKTFIVGRSTNLQGPFMPLHESLLPFETTSFIDEHPDANTPNYYVVAVMDTAGNTARSMPAYMTIADHEPPAKPEGLSGSIDTLGRVSIHWKWNKEPDLLGYRIFFANSLKHTFTPIGGIMLSDTTFRDSITLKTLSKRIYYRVIAYDRHKNPSEPSDILPLEKPDIVPPVGSVIHDFEVNDTSVRISWYPSLSKDVAAQTLLRKEDGLSSWKSIASLSPTDSTYRDTNVQAGKYYSYAIEVSDSSGLRSGPSFPLRVYVYNRSHHEEIRNFNLSQDTSGIIISWNAPPRPVDYYILFMSEGQEGLRMYGNISGELQSDTIPLTKGTYQFALKAKYKNGEESPVTEIRTVTIN